MIIILKKQAFLLILFLGISFFTLGQQKAADSIVVRKYTAPFKSTSSANSGLFSSTNNEERTDFTIQRTIALTDTTGEKDLEFTVNESTNALGILINCMLQEGLITIQIQDPQGTKKGVFQLEGSANGSSEWSEQVNGKIAKEFMNPIKGIWKIKISATKATAQIDAMVQQQ